MTRRADWPGDHSRALAGELLEVLAQEDPLNELLQGLPEIDHRLNDLDESAQSALPAFRLPGAQQERHFLTRLAAIPDFMAKAAYPPRRVRAARTA
ncbi:hypothetical protein ACWDKQ_10015 [Saccharopolyspora sp. NPDC000995]